MKFHELCKVKKFKSTPSVYFGPQELDKDKGDYPFLIQFIDDDYRERPKNKKIYYSTVIELLEDRRSDKTTSPISPGRYRFDLTEEYMAALDQLSIQGVDIFTTPIEFTHSRRYKGKHLFSFYDFKPTVGPRVTTTPAAPVSPAGTVKSSPTGDPVDDCDFNFDDE